MNDVLCKNFNPRSIKMKTLNEIARKHTAQIIIPPLRKNGNL